MEAPTPGGPEAAQTGPEEHGDTDVPRCEEPPLLTRLSLASHIYALQGMLGPLHWLREWSEYFSPPEGAPNIIKTYECGPHLPVRIFFPQSYDQTSPATLPTLFTIHGGGFCIGHIRDDDEWNRAFADTQNILVIALNYSKAPAAPFPTAIHDLEALLLALLADESLPIDRTCPSRTALLGFSAGGTLALSVSQLPSIRNHRLAPRAAIPIYGYLDLSIPAADKARNRPYKSTLSPPRNGTKDPLLALIPTFNWSYIPYNHPLRDPLLSPYFASRASLPPNIFVIATELDILAHESWRFATRLAAEGSAVPEKYPSPDPHSKEPKQYLCGSQSVRSKQGKIEVLDRKGQQERKYEFEERWEGGEVKWLLVPDALHGFDNVHIRELMGGNETVDDAEGKMREVMRVVGGWLRRVWGLEG